MNRCILFATVAVTAAASSASFAQLSAFPGAVGQGAVASGGRGGDVYHVTNRLDNRPGNAAIPGSLRYGIETATGPRTIVFDVGGGIQLSQPMIINKSNLTLAGQTSPTGVTLWGYPTEVDGGTNVIVRYIRCRTGDFNAEYPDITQAGTAAVPSAGNGNHDLLGDYADAFGITNSQQIIADHISASWSMDENTPITVSRNVTLQHSMCTESLDSTWHWKGYPGTGGLERNLPPPWDNPSHGLGGLVRGIVSTSDQAAGTGGYTVYGNLWEHNTGRNAHLGGEQGGSRAGDFNFVNNVIYNWWYQATAHVGGKIRVNYVGNYYIDGPTTDVGASIFNATKGTSGDAFVYQANNARDSDKDGVHDGAVLTQAQVTTMIGGFDTGDQLNAVGSGTPYNFYSYIQGNVVSAEEAYQRVVAGAGASLWRDSLDTRYIYELTHGTSRPGYTSGYPGYGVHPGILISQEHLRVNGILPGVDDLVVASRAAGFDTDSDGMPDAFEDFYRLNKNGAADGSQITLSSEGYTNLEVYLNSLVTGFFGPVLLVGDIDHNGSIDDFDLNVLLTNWGAVVSADQGNLTTDSGSTAVDDFDLNILLTRWTGLGSPSPLPGAVPEPEAAAILLAAVGLVGCARRKR